MRAVTFAAAQVKQHFHTKESQRGPIRPELPPQPPRREDGSWGPPRRISGLLHNGKGGSATWPLCCLARCTYRALPQPARKSQRAPRGPHGKGPAHMPAGMGGAAPGPRRAEAGESRSQDGPHRGSFAAARRGARGLPGPAQRSAPRGGRLPAQLAGGGHTEGGRAAAPVLPAPPGGLLRTKSGAPAGTCGGGQPL